MSRLSDKEIMDLLVEEGLDKRIAENPEGAKQIARIVEDAISQIYPEEQGTYVRSDNGRYTDAVKRVINEKIGGIKINENGSLSVNTTESKVELNGDKKREGKTQEFSVGEDEDLVIDTRIDSITQNAKDYRASQLFITSTFNKNGLEMKREESKRNAGVIISYMERERAKYGIGKKNGELGDYIEKLERLNLDDHYGIYRYVREMEEKAPKELKKFISFSADKYEVTRNSDLVTAEMRLSEYGVGDKGEFVSIGGDWYFSETRTATIDAVGGNEEVLNAFFDSAFERFEQGKYEISKSRGYKAGCENPAFRATLLEQAKTDPELQKVVASLALDGKVKTADLEKVYESVSDRDIKAQMDKIMEASKDDKETDKKRESDGNPEL